MVPESYKGIEEASIEFARAPNASTIRAISALTSPTTYIHFQIAFTLTSPKGGLPWKD